jgi:hypothetical protein
VFLNQPRDTSEELTLIPYISPEFVKELTKPRHVAHASSSDKAFVQVTPDKNNNIFTGLLLVVVRVISVIRHLKTRVVVLFASASNYMSAILKKDADRGFLQRIADIPIPEPFRDVLQIVTVLVFRSL